jgi:hypothetical protein
MFRPYSTSASRHILGSGWSYLVSSAGNGNLRLKRECPFLRFEPHACSSSTWHMADIDAASVTAVSGAQLFPETAGLRPLLTQFTYASSCVRRWYQPYPDSSSWYTSLYSTYGRDNYFASYQPSDGSSSLQLRYSPGICPSGQTIATITESRTVPVAEDGSGRVWLAYCCLRYVQLSGSQLAHAIGRQSNVHTI